MYLIKIFTLIIGIGFSVNVLGQDLQLNVQNKPLTEVLMDLNKNNGIQFSFDHNLVGDCIVSNTKKYKSKEILLEALLENCNLTYEILEDVFFITKKTTNPKPKVDQNYFYVGQITDLKNGESLPYSNIETNTNDFNVDDNGNFYFTSKESTSRIIISHVGYYILDTIVKPDNRVTLALTPSVIGLEEIVVKPSETLFTTHIGKKTGHIKLNHKIASFLPGNNNNTLFNMLRLQPGILASAEQEGGYIIWGSYRGQTLLEYDGIPLFNATSLNNEVGVINPLTIKDVEVHKGGFSLEKGDQVGSVVSMTGKTGNFEKMEGTINANTEMVSGRINIPLKNKYALQLSFRKSYFDFIDEENQYNIDLPDRFFSSDFEFQDVNVKFSGKTNAGDNFFISLLGNKDESSFSFTRNSFKRSFSWINLTTEEQIGASIFYNKNWKKWGSTNTTISYSKLESSSFDKTIFDRNQDGEEDEEDEEDYVLENEIELSQIKTIHLFPTLGKHKISTGLGAVRSNILLKENFFEEMESHEGFSALNRYNYFIQDQISITKNIVLQPSFKIDYLPESSKVYFRPHLDLSIKPSENWNINLAWGIYNQYQTQMNLVDELENSYTVWQLTTLDNKIPVLESRHHVLGISYKKNGVLLSAEAYYKLTNGMSRYSFKRNEMDLSLVVGRSRAMGLDLYAEKEIKKHKFWVSYSLGKVEESFGKNLISDIYIRAFHDQTHEAKVATVLNFSPWYLSANYVYGSGLYISNQVDTDRNIYHRFDLALLYKFNFDRFRIETGFSILNVFNKNNASYNSLTNPFGIKVFERATPFTPSVFVNFHF